MLAKALPLVSYSSCEDEGDENDGFKEEGVEEEDFDQGQNAIDDDSLFANDLLPLFSSSDSMEMNDRDIGQTFRHLQKTRMLLQMKLLLRFATVHGYAVSVKRSVKKKDVLKHVYYQCVRGGKCRARVDEPNRKRQKTSRRSGCPFDAVIDFHASTEQWLLKIRDARHNHNQMPHSTLPEHRRQQLGEKEGQVAAQIRSGLSNDGS
jgi:hypothetical protein